MCYYSPRRAASQAACWGNGQLLCDRDRDVRQRLGLARREHILGSLMLGYPAIRFRNKVIGKRVDIRWNGRQRPV